jgi:hypothetical protein
MASRLHPNGGGDIVGERAVELAQLAAIAMPAEMADRSAAGVERGW